MCYICREEERYDGVYPEHLARLRVDSTTRSPHTGESQVDTSVSMHSYCPRCVATPPSAPCPEINGSLLGPLLESCLLHWIQSSQENQTRVEKAFKCPQCGADYEIESDNPPLLRLLNKMNKMLTRTGKVATLVGLGTTVFTFGTCTFPSDSSSRALVLSFVGNIGVYLMCTSYGAWAVREFLGQEMYVLPPEPRKMPTERAQV